MMKGAGKIILIVAMATSCVLLYVHLQVSLFHVSYEINANSNELVKKSEQYRFIKYEVDRLRAPRRLEGKMGEMALDLTLPREVEVLRLPIEPIFDSSQAQLIPDRTISTRLMNFVGKWVGIAQAKSDV